jgi:hypothetical protein
MEPTALTLTVVAHYGRLFVKYGLITLVVLIVGRTFLSAAIGYWNAINPAPPPPPTVGFGILPSISFPSQTEGQKPSAYQLETSNGKLPTFGDRAKVFLMVKSSPNLLADQKVKQIAAKYGFVFQPTVLNDRTYRWTKATPLQSTLEMDIQNKNFTLLTNYLSKPQLFSKKDLPNELTAGSVAKSFLGAGQEIPTDMATSSGKVTFLKALGNDVVPAVSYSDADFVQVDLMRHPIDDDKQMFTPEGTKGVIHAILSSSIDSSAGVVRYEYKYQPIDYSQVHTYPLRTVATAWQVMQGGEGYIADKGTSATAVIREITLGYYDDFQEQDYLQPIYVFSGDNGFLGYVSAIDPRYIQK